MGVMGVEGVVLVATLVATTLATNGDTVVVEREELGRLTGDMLVVPNLVGGFKTLSTVTASVTVLVGGEELRLLTGDSEGTDVAILVGGCTTFASVAATVLVVRVTELEVGAMILINGRVVTGTDTSEIKLVGDGVFNCCWIS